MIFHLPKCVDCRRYYKNWDSHKKKYGCKTLEEKGQDLKKHYKWLDEHPEFDGRKNLPL